MAIGTATQEWASVNRLLHTPPKDPASADVSKAQIEFTQLQKYHQRQIAELTFLTHILKYTSRTTGNDIFSTLAEGLGIDRITKIIKFFQSPDHPNSLSYQPDNTTTFTGFSTPLVSNGIVFGTPQYEGENNQLVIPVALPIPELDSSGPQNIRIYLFANHPNAAEWFGPASTLGEPDLTAQGRSNLLSSNECHVTGVTIFLPSPQVTSPTSGPSNLL